MLKPYAAKQQHYRGTNYLRRAKAKRKLEPTVISKQSVCIECGEPTDQNCLWCDEPLYRLKNREGETGSLHRGVFTDKRQFRVQDLGRSTSV